MYLESIHIENLKCFEDIYIEFKAARTSDEDYDPQQNWNVILGNNGDGKTTLLQAMAACLMDVTTANRVLRAHGWVRDQKPLSRLTVNLKQESSDWLEAPHAARSGLDTNYEIEYMIDNLNGGRIFSLLQFYELATITQKQLEKTAIIKQSLNDQQANQLIQLSQMYSAMREERKGWISCGYGPFRRLYGITPHAAKVSDPLEERFITLFDEGAALYKCEAWLKELQRLAALENDVASDEERFIGVKKIIVELLPEIDEIRLNKEIQFLYNANLVTLSQLSDGYRSMFALIVDLLRWLEMLRSDIEIPINEASGVVLIDEIDSHLHPKWQREIGFWLTKIFPNMQFIVTTHSPFVAMAAGKGALTVLKKNWDGESIVADQEYPYIRDWAVDRVLNEVFDVCVPPRVALGLPSATVDKLLRRQNLKNSISPAKIERR